MRPARSASCEIRRASPGAVRRGTPAQQKLRVSLNAGERIIEFMGDAGNKLAERGHFFRLQKLGLDQPLAGDIAVDLEPAQARSVGLEQGPRETFHDLARRAHQFEFVPARFVPPAHVLAPARRRFGRTAELAPPGCRSARRWFPVRTGGALPVP